MPLLTANSPIIANVWNGTPEVCSAYILAKPHGGYTDWDIAHVIIPAYYDQARAVGIDPVMAIAQMIHETGNMTSWWSQRPNRNPAGIGVTGRTSLTKPSTGAWQWNGHKWEEGCAFYDWAAASIPAHLGRLCAYALPYGEGNDAQRLAISKAALWRPIPLTIRGRARTWDGLNGLWAVPGTTYGQSIAAIAQAIVNS